MSRPLSSLGFGFAVAAGRPPTVAYAEPTQGPMIGFTAPTTIYDKQREIESEARLIGPKILTYAQAEPALVDAWNRFDREWTPFFAKYAGDPHTVLPEGKIAALLYTDELAAQTNAFAERLDTIKGAYETLRAPNGQPLPPLNVPSIHPLPPPSKNGGSAFSISVPWWAWMVGGAAVLVGGYVLYKMYIGKPLAIARAAWSGDPDPEPPRRDPAALPMSLDEVAAHPRSQPILYRPYTHPHVVPMRGKPPPPSYGYGSYNPNPHEFNDVYEGLSTDAWEGDEW